MIGGQEPQENRYFAPTFVSPVVASTSPETTSPIPPPPAMPPELPGVENPPTPEKPKEEKPRDEKPKDPLCSALECYREDRPLEARKHLDSFPPAHRELLTSLLPIVARLGDAETRPQPVADLVTTLERLAQSLRARSGLSMDKLCYVRSAEGFGVYEPLSSGHTFRPGGAGRPGDLVQLYAELKNFLCVCSGSEFETSLACTLVIRDAKNSIVWEQGRPVQIERSRSPRQDCHLRCNFYVPPGLPVGDYTLWLVVKDVTGSSREDVPTGRTARRSLDFRVRAASVAVNP
jgi:hypothetical protein